MKLGRTRPSRSRGPRGSPKATPRCSRTSTSGEARPNCSRSFARPLARSAPQVSSRSPMPCCIPGAYGELSAILAELEKEHPAATLLPEEQRPPAAQWKTWLWPHESAQGLPPLRIILVLDNLAGHLSPDLLGWFFHQVVMPLYTPVGGSWLNMAESVQRIIVRRALSGQHPQNAQQVIDWLEQTVAGWNRKPTPFVWNGKR